MGFSCTTSCSTQESCRNFKVLNNINIIQYLRNYFKKKVPFGVRKSQYLVVIRTSKNPFSEFRIPLSVHVLFMDFFAEDLTTMGGSVKTKT